MINRIFPLLFILFANIVLLAHVFIPHHHHNEDLCFASSHCEKDSQPEGHLLSGHQHQHDGEENGPLCFLRQAVFLPTVHIRQECKCLNCNSKSGDNSFFTNLFLNTKFISDFLVNQSFSGKQYHPKIFYALFVSHNAGLRAPPVV